MDIVKPALDVALFTDDIDASLAFWRDEVGLPYEELLPIGPGHDQHRLTLHGAVLKVNTSPVALTDEPCGLVGLRVARPGTPRPREIVSPEGVRVEVLPPGHDGVQAFEIIHEVGDAAAARKWWVEGLGAAGDEQGRYRVGATFVRVEVQPDRAPTGALRGRGLRALTVQIRDVEAEHRHMLGLGFIEGIAPMRLGDVAYFSFVRTHDGDWLELSQRRSLTGPLPEGVPVGVPTI